MAIKLVVRYYGPEYTVGLIAFGLRVEAVSAEGMSKDIFVFQRRVPSATDAQANAQGDMFVNVANPVDLDNLPVGAPDLMDEVPFYRLSSVSLTFQNMQALHETMNLIDQDIRALVESVKELANLPVMEERTYE